MYLELCEDEHDWFYRFIMTQPVVIQMRQVCFWNIFISRSYCSKILVFITVYQNSFFGIERSEPVSVLTAWRTCLTQSGLTSQLNLINMVKTYWHFDHVVILTKLKYTWAENENLWSVGFNKKCQVYFLSQGLGVLEVQFGKSKSFKWKKDWGEHSLHCLISLGIKLSWWFCYG